MNCKVEISLYGAFRAFNDGAPIVFDAPKGARLREIKASFLIALKKIAPEGVDEELLKVSALADENEIIGADYLLHQNVSLAILPPVSGG